MHLSTYDLTQLDSVKLQELTEGQVRVLANDMLDDLKECHERLNQNSRNSSRPPSHDAPWDKVDHDHDDTSDDEDAVPTEEDALDIDKLSSAEEENTSADPKLTPKSDETSPDNSETQRKPGKQLGAPGYGRQQEIAVTAEVYHHPKQCACCHKHLDPDQAVAYTAFETVDIDWTDPTFPGIKLSNTLHTYYSIECVCGHCTRQEPVRTSIRETDKPMEVCQWRLVGPGLATLIVCLAYRMRLSRPRIKEFLGDWLALSLSVGTINNTLRESGACALPVEEQIVQAVKDSNLLHIDETPWYEGKLFLWLWVFSSQSVVAYWISHRTAELIDNVLGSDHLNWIMSDGLAVYRHFLNRLRCWAHLLRKAKGLVESLNPEAQEFGRQTLFLLNTLIGEVRAAREQPPDIPLPIAYKRQLEEYRKLCEKMKLSAHAKTHELAVEMLNDWDCIFRVLQYPHLPLTNNEAERALRHWVILRNINHGTRTRDGSRLFALSISIIETCRIRNQSPWIYFRELITARRAGLPAPMLPVMVGG
jgi:hypothetical protein